jgi:biotin carboxyl carrier protein
LGFGIFIEGIMRLTKKLNGHALDFEISINDKKILLESENKKSEFKVLKSEKNFLILLDHTGKRIKCPFYIDELEKTWISISGKLFIIDNKSNLKLGSNNNSQAQMDNISSPMPGKVFKLEVQVGELVKEGQTLVVLEAMKMEHPLKATKNGKVKSIHFSVGEQVQFEDLILELEDE